MKRGKVEEPTSESDAASKLLAFFGVRSVKVWHVRYDLLAWTKRSKREFEHVEVVDIVSENILYQRWSSFTPTLHLNPRQNFSESWIAGWPRRSREAVWFPMTRGSACQEFPMVPTMNLSELQEQIREIAKWEN